VKIIMIDRVWKLSLAIGLAMGLCALILSLVGGSHFRWTTGQNGANISIQLGTEAGDAPTVLGTISVIMLVFGLAFLVVSKQQTPRSALHGQFTSGDFLDFLQRLRKSEKDCQLGGVCGGLGEHTPVPSWVWRTLFLVLVFCVGIGVIPYLILWISMPPAKS
jgi:phage shock protein C